MQINDLIMLILPLLFDSGQAEQAYQTSGRLDDPFRRPALSFQVDNLRSPFSTPPTSTAAEQQSFNRCSRLELSAIQQTKGMQLKGVLGKEGERVAVVELADGTLVQLDVGESFVGDTYQGVITQVNQADIVVRQDERGCRRLPDITVSLLTMKGAER